MSSKRAFTLIELLVVISVIALLMAIMMPALAKVRESANRTVCASRIRQSAAGCIMYAMGDLKQRVPMGAFGMEDGNYSDLINMNGGSGDQPGPPYGILAKCVGDPRVLVCPTMAKTDHFRGVDVVTGQRSNGSPYRPYIEWPIAFRLGYNYMGGHPTDTFPNPPPGNALWWDSPQTLKDSGKLVLFSDYTTDGEAAVAAAHGSRGYVESFLLGTDIKTLARGGGVNVAKLGGSVKWKHIKDCEKYQAYHYAEGIHIFSWW